jgi:hypothetical protein
VESNPLTAIEKRYLVESAKLVEIRNSLTEFFSSFTQPRKLDNKECFLTLGLFLKAFLDVIIKEKATNLKELHSIM